MGLSPDIVFYIIYVFGVSCAIPCAFFLLGLRIKNVCSTLFPAVPIRAAFVVFVLL